MKCMNTAKAWFIDYSKLFHFMCGKTGKFESVCLIWLLQVYLMNVRVVLKHGFLIFYLWSDFLCTTAGFAQKFTFNKHNRTLLLQRALPCKDWWRLILFHSFSSGASKKIGIKPFVSVCSYFSFLCCSAIVSLGWG